MRSERDATYFVLMTLTVTFEPKVLGQLQTVSTCSFCNGPLTAQHGGITGRQHGRDKIGRQVSQQWFCGTPGLSPGGGQRPTVQSHSQRFCSAVGATHTHTHTLFFSHVTSHYYKKDQYRRLAESVHTGLIEKKRGKKIRVT